MAIKISRGAAFLVLVLSASIVVGANKNTKAKQAPAPGPAAAAEPSNPYLVSVTTRTLGAMLIRVTQVKPHAAADWSCRALLKVETGDRVLFERKFTIDPAGGPYGLFVSDASRDPLVIAKAGDGGSRLFVVFRDGQVLETDGGAHWVSSDGRYLVTFAGPERTRLLVVDLKKRSSSPPSLDKGRAIPSVYAWYRDTTGYFFTAVGAGPEGEDRRVIYRHQFDKGRLRAEKPDPTQFVQAVQVPFDFSFGSDAACQ